MVSTDVVDILRDNILVTLIDKVEIGLHFVLFCRIRVSHACLS